VVPPDVRRSLTVAASAGAVAWVTTRRVGETFVETRLHRAQVRPTALYTLTL